MNNIQNIVFDFGGVLVKYDFKAYFIKVFDGDEKRCKWFLDNILSSENNDLADKADKPFDEYIREWKQKWPNYAFAIDSFDKHYTDIFTSEMPGMYDWMMDLKAKGYRLLGLSNWSTKVFDVMKKFPRVFSPLEGYLVSHEVHLLKPDVAIYQAFCKRFNVAPGECVFIDDKPENIIGARKAGLHAILFKDTESAKNELEKVLAE